MTFLSDILDSTRRSVAERRSQRPLAALQASAAPRDVAGVFHRALQSDYVSIIAEFKRESPSEGKLGRKPDVGATVQAYERAGASAISVLTESTRFGGALADLATARESCQLPLLCKDFIIDESQVYEAAEAGADAVLLIDAALSDQPEQLQHLREVAGSLRLDVLVEVRNELELGRALDVEPELIGINNRNLDDLTTNFDTTRRLVAAIPDEVIVVSESGLRIEDHLRDLGALGVDAALIGTAFMNAADPEATCRALTGAPKAPRSTDLATHARSYA